MASSTKTISIIFLFALFSMQIHAREFFSKIPSVNNNEHNTFTPETQKTSVPYREEKTFGKEEQEPRFIPETQNGYGLYGQESSQLPPSTTTTTTKETYEPYVTPVRYHPDEPYNSIPASSVNNNKNTVYYNKDSYETEQKNFGEAMFTEKGWSTEENRNNNYYNGNNGYNNGEKQGMSDTRFLENGKYYHDIKNENNYYPNQYENNRGVASRNEYNENRYRYNNMGRYNQNQEFEENEEVFEP